MKYTITTGILMCLMLFLLSNEMSANTPITNTVQDSTQVSEQDKLVIVWTSGDREVALKMVFMYTYNAKKFGWWKDITLLVWGPSAKLLTEDEELQNNVKEMKELGVNLLACKGCADSYGIADQLTDLGVTVRYTGTDLTNFIKERKVVTF